MKILSESKSFILCHEYEDVFLKDKRNGATHDLGNHYGDPRVGLISPDENWFITAGEGVLYFDFERGLREYLREGFKDNFGKDGCAFIHSARIESSDSVRILIDPWSEHASTWVLSISSLTVTKIKDGPCMDGKPWQEEIEY